MNYLDKDHDTVKDWDRIWNISDQNSGTTFLGRFMFAAKRKALLQLLDGLNIKSVIEVGCGLGRILAIYQQAGYNCIGIDASEHAVLACRNKGLNAFHRLLADEHGRYDLVSSDGMLEHFLNFTPYALDMMHISNRYVLLFQPNHQSFLGKTMAYLAELVRGDAIMFEYNYKLTDFIDVFSRNNFILKKNIPVFGDVFRLLLFMKKTAAADTKTCQPSIPN